MIAQYPVIAITGPRQSGKTTLLKNMFPDYRYISLENPESRESSLMKHRMCPHYSLIFRE
jgi:predicted AAA+ superfamily ATPase